MAGDEGSRSSDTEPTPEQQALFDEIKVYLRARGARRIEDAAWWAAEPLDKIVRVPVRWLDVSAPRAMFVVAEHELTHLDLTRIPWFRSEVIDSDGTLPAAAIRLLANVAEDCRVNATLLERHPTLKGDLDAVYRTQRAAKMEIESRRAPAFVRFAEYLIDRYAQPEPLLPPPPVSVSSALTEVDGAILRYRECRPTAHSHACTTAELAASYGSRAVPALQRAFAKAPVSPNEQRVLLAQLDALASFQRIRRIAARLWHVDLERIEKHLASSTSLSVFAECAVTANDVATIRRITDILLTLDAPDGPLGARALATAVMLGNLGALPPPDCVAPLGDPEAPSEGRSREDEPSEDDVAEVSCPEPRRILHLPSFETEASWRSGCDTAAELAASIEQETAAEAAELVKSLRSAFPHGDRHVILRRQRSGRLDVREIMRGDASGVPCTRPWYRRTRAHAGGEIEPVCFAILIDCSASMRGARSRHAAAAASLIAHAASELHIPSCIGAFMDKVCWKKTFSDPFGPKQRKALAKCPFETIGESRGYTSPAYNDDATAVLAAAKALRRRGERRFLIVLSDGCPDGRNTDEDDLVTALRRIAAPPYSIHAIGVGIESDHVRSFYEHHAVCARAEELTTLLPELFRRIVRRCG